MDKEEIKVIDSIEWILKKQIWKKIRPVSRFVKMKVHGELMIIELSQVSDPDDNFLFEIWRSGYYEPETTQYFINNIKPGDTVVDVGAGFGYYTLLFAKLVGSTGRVYAFEPSPITYKILKKNVGKYEQVKLYNIALGDENKIADFYLNAKAPNLSSLLPQPWTNKVVQVEVVVFDDYFKIPHVDFIKIDAEGADGMVLRGMKKTIDRNSNIRFTVEFNPYDYPREYSHDILNEIRDFDMTSLDKLNILCESEGRVKNED